MIIFIVFYFFIGSTMQLIFLKLLSEAPGYITINLFEKTELIKTISENKKRQQILQSFFFETFFKSNMIYYR
jgi:hypothetical protein